MAHVSRELCLISNLLIMSTFSNPCIFIYSSFLPLGPLFSGKKASIVYSIIACTSAGHAVPPIAWPLPISYKKSKVCMRHEIKPLVLTS